MAVDQTKYLKVKAIEQIGTAVKNNYVKKVAGKGLSTEDYTTAEQTKLSGVATGAQVNVLEGVKLNGTALTPDANKAVDIAVPTKTSDLTNDDNVVKDASYVHTDNNFTNAKDTKLTGIAEGAQVNVLESVKVNGTAQTITDKGIDITVPTNNNQLTNGAGYQTASDVTGAISAATSDMVTNTGLATTLADYATKSDVSSVYKYKGSVANYAALPVSGQVAGDVYNVEAADKTHGIKAGDNVAWNGTAWDVLAGTVDLTGYVTEDDFIDLTDAEVEAFFV